MTAKPKSTPPRPGEATYQDVLDAPPHLVTEILAGTLHTQPRPAFPHAWASSLIGGTLVNPFSRGNGGPGGWWIIDEPELHLDEDILVPDLAGWRRETMPNFPDGAYCTIAPDWVCEVLSPSTRGIDIGPKRQIYGREGVRHLWFVDPDARSLEVFELRGGLWVLLATLFDDAEICQPPFEAISFPLDVLWVPRPVTQDKKNTPEPASGPEVTLETDSGPDTPTADEQMLSELKVQDQDDLKPDKTK